MDIDIPTWIKGFRDKGLKSVDALPQDKLARLLPQYREALEAAFPPVKRRPLTADQARKEIGTGNVIDWLHDVVDGNVNASAQQIHAARLLLSLAIPPQAPAPTLPPGHELGVQYVLRGPPVCKTREEYCRLTGTTVYQEPGQTLDSGQTVSTSD